MAGVKIDLAAHNKIKNSETSVNYQVFPENYFSGCDVSVFIGDVWVEEVVSISFAVMEQVQPIFGYNSYTYDTVARGSRVIEGSLRINFTEGNYLNRILQNALSRSSNLKGYAQNPQGQYSWQTAKLTSDTKVFENTTLKDLSANALRAELDKQSQEQRNDYINKIRKAVWGTGMRDGIYKRPDGTPIEGQGHEDLYLNMPLFDQDPLGFRIIITYGQPMTGTKPKSLFNAPPGAVRQIVGVQLKSAQQVIGAGGEPVYEDYGFLAKDIN